MALPWWQHHKHCLGYYYYYIISNSNDATCGGIEICILLLLLLIILLLLLFTSPSVTLLQCLSPWQQYGEMVKLTSWNCRNVSVIMLWEVAAPCSGTWGRVCCTCFTVLCVDVQLQMVITLRFEVTFLFNGQASSDVPVFILTPSNLTAVLHEQYLAGKFGQTVRCIFLLYSISQS